MTNLTNTPQFSEKKIWPPLLNWYKTHRRELPWRAPLGQFPNPYHVWLSEIMLQQTTVATVKGYFDRFISRWPTVQDLAAANQETVLEEWAGLGYYARARNLHKCAQSIAANHGGIFPHTPQELIALPGIGDYSANSIAAIAFNAHSNVVDGNIERIISRLYRIDTPLPAAKKIIKALNASLSPSAKDIISNSNSNSQNGLIAGDYAQGLMDVGANICRPKSPDCTHCPLASFCEAYKVGDMEHYPIKPPKKKKPTRHCTAFWIECDGHILLERRPDTGLLGGTLGLFSTPWQELKIDKPSSYMQHSPIKTSYEQLGFSCTHTFTHFHLHTNIITASLQYKANVENAEWVAINHVKTLPTVFKKMANAVLHHRDPDKKNPD